MILVWFQWSEVVTSRPFAEDFHSAWWKYSISVKSSLCLPPFHGSKLKRSDNSESGPANTKIAIPGYICCTKYAVYWISAGAFPFHTSILTFSCVPFIQTLFQQIQKTVITMGTILGRELCVDHSMHRLKHIFPSKVVNSFSSCFEPSWTYKYVSWEVNTKPKLSFFWGDWLNYKTTFIPFQWNGKW